MPTSLPSIIRIPAFRIGKYPRKLRKSRTLIFAFSIVALLITGLLINQGISRADSKTTFAYYLDAPLVQNSYIWTDNQNSSSTHLASFDALRKYDDCSFDEFTGATFTNNPGGYCRTEDDSNWGGASTTGSNPTAGGYTNAPFGGTSMYGTISGAGATITFDNPQRYFGIWWSAGSYGNQLKFYSGHQIVGVTSADDVMSRLADPSSSFGSNGGNSFSRDLYYGHPASYSPIEVNNWNQITEVTDLSKLEDSANFYKGPLDPPEPFTYIHFFTDNDATFDRVVMSAPGNGFEFDNIVVSDEFGLLSNLNPRLVQQGTVLLPTEVQFDPNESQGGRGQRFSQFASTPTALPFNCPDYPSRCVENGMAGNPNFIGWNTEPDGSGTQFGTFTDEVYGWQYFDQEMPSATYDFASPLTLYAQWSYNFRFLSNPIDHSNWISPDPSKTPYLNVIARSNLIFPSPAPRAGFIFSGWAIDNYAWWLGPRDGDLVVIGQPGDEITPEQYTQDNFTTFYEIWTQGSTPVTNPVIQATSSKLPVDPRVTQVTIPSLPVDTESFNLCLSEVTDASGVQKVAESDLTFSKSTSSGATGPMDISANSPITSGGSRFIRITVSDTSFGDCEYGNSITIELSPLQLGAENTITVPIGRQ